MKKHWRYIRTMQILLTLMLRFDMFDSFRLVEPIKSFEPFSQGL